MSEAWQRLLQRPRWARGAVHIHLVGIGGAGLSAIATVLHEEGYTVSGCDRAPSAVTAGLAQRGIVVHQGHAAAHLAGVSLVLASSAVPPDAPELAAARANGIPVLRRGELLAELMRGRVRVAVAGTHGKTTTTGMIAWVLTQAGRDPTFIVGGHLPDLGTNARAGRGLAFVIEADEYDRMFLGLTPTVAVITAVEWDHPDCYPTPEAFLAAFASFIARVPAEGWIIGCMDDPGVQRLRLGCAAQGQWEGYGLETKAEWQAMDVRPNAQGGSDFTVLRSGQRRAQVSLALPGKHNVRDALAALAAVAHLGVEVEEAAHILRSFHGATRRFEVKGEVDGIMVIDDYGHHPTEIQATLAAARQRFPGRAIWAVFQPHTFSRTRALLDEFAAAFADADHVIITDIYAARERDDLGMHASHIVGHMSHPDARYIGNLDEVVVYLLRSLRPDDVLITLGAGDGYLVGEQVLAGLRERTQTPRG